MLPLITIVLPTHNRPALLAEAVGSVASQQLTEWELIIIDDGSTAAVDLGVFPQIEGRARLHRNVMALGGAASKSLGASMASAELVTFLDDDDLYDERYLKETVRIMQQYPEIDVLFVDVGWFGQEAQESGKAHAASLERVVREANPEWLEDDVVLFREELFAQLLRTVPMAFQRVVARRHILAEIGYYRPECLLWDGDWALRAALRHRCALLTLPLYRQRAEGQGYHSRPDRILAQHLSAVEIVTRLHRTPDPTVSASNHDMLRHAVARTEADLAYLLAQDGDLLDAWKAWWRSQRASVNLSLWKIPFGALWQYCAKLTRRRQ